VLHLADGKDYRLDRLKGMNVYHMPSGPEADAALNLAFDDLTDDRPGKAERIGFRGRDIFVPKADGAVAQFGFADLCGSPLGPGDFLAIAKRYRSVIISGVPVLNSERRDAARRFVTLIDTLYDNHVHVIVSADALPQDLYSGDDWGFEFERTVSRLMEMQSADYIESARSDAAVAA
jgi:cell division protein ZapE